MHRRLFAAVPVRWSSGQVGPPGGRIERYRLGVLDELLLSVHAGVTLAMVGVIWAVQLTIYPQFRSVSPADFGAYVEAHSRRIVSALAVFAPAEMLTALLVFLLAPGDVGRALAFGAGALLAAAWISTALWYAPLHGRLQGEPYNAASIELLIRTNWIRTALWSARGVLALMLLG